MIRRMKKAMLVVLFAAAALAAQSAGRLYIHLDAGFDVAVDGVSAGQTTDADGGKILQLAPGPHHIVVRSADGREGSFDVTLAAGEAKDLTVSPLGLRRKLAPPAEGTAGILRVACVPADCKVAFKPPADAVPPGRYPLSVTRGTSALQMDVEIPESTIVTVEANFNAGTIRITDSRKRPRKLGVAEANDALTTLAVPPHWKSAIRGALPAGIGIEGAVTQGNAVKVTLRVPSANVGASLVRAVSNSSAFVDVVAAGAPRADKSGWLFDLIFYFPD